MYDKAWLESLKEGDEVYVPGRYGAVGTIEKVKRLTATQIIVEERGATNSLTGNRETCEVRYRKEDGFIVGGDRWARGHIAEITDEVRAQISRMELRTFIHGVHWKDVKTSQLKRIVAILKEGVK